MTSPCPVPTPSRPPLPRLALRPLPAGVWNRHSSTTRPPRRFRRRGRHLELSVLFRQFTANIPANAGWRMGTKAQNKRIGFLTAGTNGIGVRMITEQTGRWDQAAPEAPVATTLSDVVRGVT
jgi:hypothetical protein